MPAVDPLRYKEVLVSLSSQVSRNFEGENNYCLVTHNSEIPTAIDKMARMLNNFSQWITWLKSPMTELMAVTCLHDIKATFPNIFALKRAYNDCLLKNVTETSI